MSCFTRPMVGCLLILLNFQRVLAGDTWPDYAECPIGRYPNHAKTFDFHLKDIPSIQSLIETGKDLLLEKSFEGGSSLQNLTKIPNCGPSGGTVYPNLCDDDKDIDLCPMDRVSLCIRKETEKLPLFHSLDVWSKMVMHDYHCDDKKNKLYYAFALRRPDDEDNNPLHWPANLEPEVHIVPVPGSSIGSKLMTARVYFFHYLPNLVEKRDFYVVGFLYMQFPLTAGNNGMITNVLSMLGHT